jgi:hypothetical protein
LLSIGYSMAYRADHSQSCRVSMRS